MGLFKNKLTLWLLLSMNIQISQLSYGSDPKEVSDCSINPPDIFFMSVKTTGSPLTRQPNVLAPVFVIGGS
jgi:hypothetical protein